MEQVQQQKSQDFIERRVTTNTPRADQRERRQFRDGQSSLRSEVLELADAVDQYKIQYRRRFITFDELYDVIADLGYHK
jgi:NTP pyrophosphatase (non-canonical NTP hydrolase)